MKVKLFIPPSRRKCFYPCILYQDMNNKGDKKKSKLVSVDLDFHAISVKH